MSEDIENEMMRDLAGERGRAKQSAAVLDVADRILSREMNGLVVKGSGDIGIKRIDQNTMVIAG